MQHVIIVNKKFLQFPLIAKDMFSCYCIPLTISYSEISTREFKLEEFFKKIKVNFSQYFFTVFPKQISAFVCNNGFLSTYMLTTRGEIKISVTIK